MALSKVVPFRNETGISQALIQRLGDAGKKYGLNAIFPFSTDKINVAEWVHFYRGLFLSDLMCVSERRC